MTLIVFGILLVEIAIAIYMTIYFSKNKSTGSKSTVELGVVFIWAVFLYAFFPLVGIMLANAGIGQMSDRRLGDDIPDPMLVINVGLSFAIFMLAFALAYSTARNRQIITMQQYNVVTARDANFILIAVIVLKLAVFGFTALLGNAVDNDYAGSYTAFRGQSLIVQQIANLLLSTDFNATILLIVVAVARGGRFQRIIGWLVLIQILLAIFGGGARTSGFLMGTAFLVSQSFFDKSFRLKSLLWYGLFGTIAFTFAGIIRADESLIGKRESIDLLQSGEFAAVFYTAMDLLDKTGDGNLQGINIGLYLVDLLRFIPKQIVGDLKIDPSAFYVSTFYPEYAEAGGGLAFGAIAESMLGWGWFEALIRGGLLGIVYAAIANKCLTQKLSLVRIFVYIWFLVMCYVGIRDTTFSVIPRFIMSVGPLLIFLKISGIFKYDDDNYCRSSFNSSKVEKL